MYLDFGFVPDLTEPGARESWERVREHLAHPVLAEALGKEAAGRRFCPPEADKNLRYRRGGGKMLRLSTRTRYALRTMIELARHEGKGMVALKAVAEAQELSPKYLEQLAIALRHAGLVLAERGAQGGYMLARPAAKISVLEVVQAVEGPVELVTCVGQEPECERVGNCTAHGLWSRLNEAVRGCWRARRWRICVGGTASSK